MSINNIIHEEDQVKNHKDVKIKNLRRIDTIVMSVFLAGVIGGSLAFAYFHGRDKIGQREKQNRSYCQQMQEQFSQVPPNLIYPQSSEQSCKEILQGYQH